MTERINVIHITGASGSGISTLGAALEKRFGYKQLDTDDFFWLPTNPPFTSKRPKDERLDLMRGELEKHGRCVISGSLSGWGDPLIPYFDLVVYVDIPASVRLERLRRREYARFGERIRPGGDMYEAHVAFMKWAGEYDTGGMDMRSRVMHQAWLAALPCPYMTVDGQPGTDEIIMSIREKYNL